MSNEKLENVVVANKLEKIQGRGPGSRLRKAREAKGFSVEEVARKLFLNSQVVHQLENDDYKSHHSITFIRGYLRSYARLVDVDTESLIAEFNAMGLTDAAPPMSTQRIYHKDSSIVSKSLPWVGTAVAVVVLLFVISWVHSEFSSTQITNPTVSAENAVAATVTQTNNAVNVALTPPVNSSNVSSDNNNPGSAINNTASVTPTAGTTDATAAVNNTTATAPATTTASSVDNTNQNADTSNTVASNNVVSAAAVTPTKPAAKNLATKTEKTKSVAVKSKTEIKSQTDVAVTAKPKSPTIF